MKIIAVLDNEIGSGGGFDQAINALLQLNKISGKDIEFKVCTTNKKNLVYLERFEIESYYQKLGIVDRILIKMYTNKIWNTFQRKLKLTGPFERMLTSHGCDLVYFLTPSNISLSLQKLNYISTLWDLSHRDSPEFPEVRNFGAFYGREENFRYSLAKSFLILVDSEELVKLASLSYGIERSRFLVMPFSPSFSVQKDISNAASNVLEKYKLKKGYFYYPAQFWSHKNHIRIIEAMSILRDKYNWQPDLVLSGKDYGNLAHLRKFIYLNNMQDNVKILGFIPPEEIKPIYSESLAIVVPTYFGYTNLPPLEAWYMKIPLIYNRRFAEQAGDAAILVNPDDAYELADAMLACKDQRKIDALVSNGVARLSQINDQREKAERLFLNSLLNFASRRKCWE